jgi:hypothetical protein
MNPTGKKQAVRAMGVFLTLIALAGESLGAPLALAATRSEGPAPTEALPPVCGGPDINSAPAMVACDSGGVGAESCETKQTVSVGGFGYTSGCGVSCNVGSYACCQDSRLTRHAQCSCQPDPPRGPWTPETL